jgi:hypothetical protein
MKKKYLLLLTVQLLFAVSAFAQFPKMDKLLYGVAYYDEYMPYERLDKDVQMMKDCGINVVRIAESTWSTVEPQDGVFDFTHIDRVLNAMQKARYQRNYRHAHLCRTYLDGKKTSRNTGYYTIGPKPIRGKAKHGYQQS